MSLKGLKGPIISVGVFDKTTPATLDTSIPGYLGDTLYITDAHVETNNVLVVTIDDQGPPVMPRFSKTTFTAVKVLISYKNGAFSTATSAGSVVYGGMPLVLTGSVIFHPAANKYDAAEIVPIVSEWAQPQRGLEYIVVQQSNVQPDSGNPALNELRWFSTPINVSVVTTSAQVIPMPIGPGVQGPFGIETPSP